MNKFLFDRYEWDEQSRTARFYYGFTERDERFCEEVTFQEVSENYDTEVLNRVLFLAFVLVGTSYYKTFPTREVQFSDGVLIDDWQAEFFTTVYQEGMAQFAFENNLTRNDLARFTALGTTELNTTVPDYKGDGLLVLQSGGKDSLLTSVMLTQKQRAFTPWYLTNSDTHPAVIDEISQTLYVTRRRIDSDALRESAASGGKNGHVPVTYIVQTFALLQAILTNKNQVLTSIAHEGEEPHVIINDDLAVSHQWSKAWPAEEKYVEYVHRYISNDLSIGSALRKYSELKVAKLFVESGAWQKYGHSFSSCNLANYTQDADNTHLQWCGNCPKCANSYLLFAPFVDTEDLKSLFGGQDLFEKESLQETFKGLLGVDGVMKPFECVGEVDELRTAYHMAQERGGYGILSFECPSAAFDYEKEYPVQDWARQLL